ncbi:MAG: hypothetical protein LBP43_02295 [Treponema sp.]|nr:hypothetical protein [Treponema sp.]
MRKLLGILVVIIILGGVVFFFGWVQLAVPPGFYGVLRSKTHGVDKGLIREGEFRWVWYRLIPTNTEITLFSPVSVERPLEIGGVLPSGEIYAAFAGIAADFSYKVEGSFSFTLKAGILPRLMEEEGISNQEDLLIYADKLASSVSLFVSQWFRQYGEDEINPEDLLRNGFPKPLEAEIRENFPEIDAFSGEIHGVRYPDFDLYYATRSLYEEYLSRQQEFLRREAAAAADDHISSQLRYDELAKYGELLTKYPLLLYYLAIERGVDPQKWNLFRGMSGPGEE